MKSLLFSIHALLCMKVITGQGPKLYMHKADIELKPNPYLSYITAEISGDSDTLTVNAGIIKEPASNLIFTNYVYLDGAELPAMTKLLCEMFEDKVFAPDILAEGIPKPFPKGCPINPGNYSIDKYKFRSSKLPPGLPECDITSIIVLHPEEEPDNIYLTINVESSLKYTVPKLPGFGK